MNDYFKKNSPEKAERIETEQVKVVEKKPLKSILRKSITFGTESTTSIPGKQDKSSILLLDPHSVQVKEANKFSREDPNKPKSRLRSNTPQKQ